MRPVCVFGKGPGSEIEQLRACLRGRWRQAALAVMVLVSLQGLSPAQIAVLLECHPATVRAGSAGSTATGWRDWPTGPARVSPARRQAADQEDRRAAGPAGAMDLPRSWRYLGRPQVRMRTLYRRVVLVAMRL